MPKVWCRALHPRKYTGPDVFRSTNPSTRVVEVELCLWSPKRIMFFLAEPAAEINGFLARSIPESTPRTVSDSFAAGVRSGAIDIELIARLDPDDGPLNVVVQLSLESDPDAVAEIVARRPGGVRRLRCRLPNGSLRRQSAPPDIREGPEHRRPQTGEMRESQPCAHGSASLAGDSDVAQVEEALIARPAHGVGPHHPRGAGRR